MPLNLVIPAAGNGSRLGVSVPKALFQFQAKPLIDWVVRASQGIFDNTIVVIKPGHLTQFHEWALHAPARPKQIQFVFQETASGSFDAVLLGLRSISDGSAAIVVWGDQVGVSSKTLQLVSSLLDQGCEFVSPISEVNEPYVWLIRDQQGEITEVRRKRDGDVPPETGFSDVGVFGFSRRLVRAIRENPLAFRPSLVEGRELDFTYAIPSFCSFGKFETPLITDRSETIAINSSDDLKYADQHVGGKTRS